MSEDFTRRTVFKKIGGLAGGATAAIMLPERWTKPIVDSMISPANAGFQSYCVGSTWVMGSRGQTMQNSPFCPVSTTPAPTTS